MEIIRPYGKDMTGQKERRRAGRNSFQMKPVLLRRRRSTTFIFFHATQLKECSKTFSSYHLWRQKSFSWFFFSPHSYNLSFYLLPLFFFFQVWEDHLQSTGMQSNRQEKMLCMIIRTDDSESYTPNVSRKLCTLPLWWWNFQQHSRLQVALYIFLLHNNTHM